MRAILLLLVFILAPAAAQEQDQNQKARMLAARALLTARAISDRPKEAVELARPLIRDLDRIP